MAIAFGSVGTLYEAFNDLTNTKSFTLTAGRELVVAVVWNLDVNIITATWNTSETLVAVGSKVAQGNLRLQFYKLASGTSGAHDIFIEFDGDPNVCCILAADYSGIATSSEVEGATAGNGNTANPTVTVASMDAASFAISFFGNGGGQNMTDLTTENGTIRAKLQGASGFGIGLIDNTPTAGSAVTSGTWGGNDNWVGMGAEFLEAGGGGGLLIPIADRYYAQLRGE